MAAIKRPTLDAEEAIFGLNLLKSLQLREPQRTRGRRPAYVRAQLRLQNELQIGRAVGIAENYLLMRAVRARRTELLQPVPAPNPVDPMTSRLRDARLKFHLLVAFWEGEFGVKLDRIGGWADFQGLRDLRNVVVHRLGLWQPALDPQPRLRDRIARITNNPDLYRGLVPLSENEFLAACEVLLKLLRGIERRKVV